MGTGMFFTFIWSISVSSENDDNIVTWLFCMKVNTSE